MRAIEHPGPSLERRLVQRIGVLYALALLIVSAAYLGMAWSHRQVELGLDLGDIAGLLGASVRNEGGVLRVTPSAELSAKLENLDAFTFAVLDVRTGEPVAGSSMAPLPISRQTVGATAIQGDFTFQSADGSWHYGTVRTVETPSGNFVVEMLSGSSVARAVAWVRHELLVELFPIFVPLALASVAIVWWTVRRTLAPLRAISRDADAVRSGATDRRLIAREAPTEILPVINAVNHALQRLEEALRLQQRFTANAAHELRTPLAVLRVRIDALEEGPTKDGIARDVDRMAHMVDQLLTVARLEAKQFAPEAEIDLTAMVRSCLAQIAPLAVGQGKDVVLSAPEAPIVVWGNIAALEHVVRNLLDNALRVTPVGEATEVTVSPGATVQVRDHGPGVGLHLKERLFKPFWRGDIWSGGTGLGLAIVAEAVGQHAGQVVVENHPDGGAVFRIAIPQIRGLSRPSGAVSGSFRTMAGQGEGFLSRRSSTSPPGSTAPRSTPVQPFEGAATSRGAS